MNEIAERYAEALFSLAREENKVREIKAQMSDLLIVVEETPELTGFFSAVKITADEKKNLVENVFGEVLDTYIVNFLKLLIDKGRIMALKDISKQFIHLANEELGIQEVKVYSARKLSDSDLDRIRTALEKKVGKEVIIENQLDASLIAGIKVVMGNNVTDATMRRKIDEMKENLLKGGGLA